jgi:hypothetical protein
VKQVTMSGLACGGVVCGLWLAGGGLVGCQSATIAVWEKLGYAKREQLVEKVEEARDSQRAAKEQFASTLEQFKALTGFSGGELEAQYRKLQREYDRCASAAQEVGTRIDKTEGVARAMFGEWRNELDGYQDPGLRTKSEGQLLETQRLYERLIGSMRQAEGKMKPVLAAMNDRVLFLKHNLNAAAIASLSGEVRLIEGDVSRLIAEMNQSIAEADAFIGQMKR